VYNIHTKYGIQDSDFYNFDEMRFMIGMVHPGMVITWADQISKLKSIQPGNQEWAIAIYYVTGDGYAIPPFLIVQGHFYLTNWFRQAQIPDNWAIKIIANGGQIMKQVYNRYNILISTQNYDGQVYIGC
jgi:hypothetical protein